MDRIHPGTVPCNAATHPTQKFNCFLNLLTNSLNRTVIRRSANRTDLIFRDTSESQNKGSMPVFEIYGKRAPDGKNRVASSSLFLSFRVLPTETTNHTNHTKKTRIAGDFKFTNTRKGERRVRSAAISKLDVQAPATAIYDRANVQVRVDNQTTARQITGPPQTPANAVGRSCHRSSADTSVRCESTNGR